MGRLNGFLTRHTAYDECRAWSHRAEVDSARVAGQRRRDEAEVGGAGPQPLCLLRFDERLWKKVESSLAPRMAMVSQ